MSDEYTEKEGGKAFVSDRAVDTDGVVGARWWNQALIEADSAESRRGFLKAFGLTAVAVMTCNVVCAETCGGGDDSYDMSDYTFIDQRSLELQKTYGWDFGASNEALVFDGATTAPFDPAMIDALEADLTPSVYRALHVPTLLQSPNATPTQRPAEEVWPFEPLARRLRPISTPQMDRAYARGAALAKLLAAQRSAPALVVDLPGPEAVAFAAGAAEVFEPVLLFDNWPHPKGVVPSHLVLAAALYYQPRLVLARTARGLNGLPMFVLDRARLTAYTDLTSQFDNRYVARVPSPVAMSGDKVKWLLYVVGAGSDLPEQEDLNDAFMAWQTAGLRVRALSLDMFAEGNGELVYVGDKVSGDGRAADFVADYPADGSGVTADVGGQGRMARSYAPSTRYTPYHSGVPGDFGTTSVVLAAGTNAVLGARFDRRGSWNRTGG